MSETYELAPEPEAPNLPGTVIVRPTPEEAVETVAVDLLAQANACVRKFGDFHLALSGGSTPAPLYCRLMIDPLFREFPWKRTHLWIVDERCVGFESEQSNSRMIQESIGEHSDIPTEQLHLLDGSVPGAAEQYERALCESLEWREPGQDRLDFVLLGMGGDAHTASLFPGSPVVLDALAGQNEDRLIRHHVCPTAVPPDRITMTYRLLNASRFLGVLVTGESKSATIRTLSQSDSTSQETLRDKPILGIRPLQGELRWYLDSPAAGWKD